VFLAKKQILSLSRGISAMYAVSQAFVKVLLGLHLKDVKFTGGSGVGNGCA